MKLQKQRFGRSLWLNLLVINLAMSGIYGLNLVTVRKALLTIAVSIVFTGIALMFTGRSENCGNSAAQR